MTESNADPDPDAAVDADTSPHSDPDSEPETETDPTTQPTDRGPTANDGAEPEDATLGVSVVTIASNRTLDDDTAGQAIETALENEGFSLATREHVAPSHDRVQSIVLRVIERDDVDVVITAGGASVEPDDIVIEAVEPLLDKQLDGFSHLFTTLAYEQMGTRAVAARTLAGVAEETPVFCLPGNAESARLGTEEIILSEAGHLVELARSDEPDDENELDDDQ
ncbi:molybdenum cofactor biosynthesis protein B [Natrialbaceae archaeon A-arb3/5]